MVECDLYSGCVDGPRVTEGGALCPWSGSGGENSSGVSQETGRESGQEQQSSAVQQETQAPQQQPQPQQVQPSEPAVYEDTDYGSDNDGITDYNQTAPQSQMPQTSEEEETDYEDDDDEEEDD